MADSPQEGGPLLLMALAELHPGVDGEHPDYELRIGTPGEDEDASAYIAVASAAELVDVVLALTATIG